MHLRGGAPRAGHGWYNSQSVSGLSLGGDATTKKREGGGECAVWSSSAAFFQLQLFQLLQRAAPGTMVWRGVEAEFEMQALRCFCWHTPAAAGSAACSLAGAHAQAVAAGARQRCVSSSRLDLRSRLCRLLLLRLLGSSRCRAHRLEEGGDLGRQVAWPQGRTQVGLLLLLLLAGGRLAAAGATWRDRLLGSGTLGCCCCWLACCLLLPPTARLGSRGQSLHRNRHRGQVALR